MYLRQKGRGQNAWPKSMLKICEMTEKEVQEIAAIEAENFSKPWSKKGFLDAVRDEHALYLTAWEEETPVGYAGMWIALDEGEITNVSVKKDRQGRKIGTVLLIALEEAGQKRGVDSFFLEVRKSNEKAIALYEKTGFVRMGIRNNFYEDPKDDGFVMCKI